MLQALLAGAVPVHRYEQDVIRVVLVEPGLVPGHGEGAEELAVEEGDVFYAWLEPANGLFGAVSVVHIKVCGGEEGRGGEGREGVVSSLAQS